ncbi:NB-ARC domain-containing protein [Lentzea sp. NPDC034063]|uniref:NB-ARC domain-containing protein n=1 Tax=unclassified Lentzea TaxID=2643253 RepID=UPI0033BFF563
MSDDLDKGSVHNSVTGDVYGPLVQAGYVSGDINLHTHTTLRPPAELPLRIGVVPQRAAAFQHRELPWKAVTVLSGLGGVGKTQLAADHAATEWAAGNVSLLVWVTAGSRNAIVSTFAEAAAELTGRDEPDLERGARKFLEWLAAKDEPWLVVLDDLQDPEDLTGLWPPDNGRTLVTTRRRDAALRGHERQILDVETFSETESLNYLRTVLADRPALLDGAAEVVRELGGLPLALAQAGAYVLDQHLSCADYLGRLAKSRRTSVAATWSLSIERANSTHPKRVAGRLLDVISVLDPHGIPLDVLTEPSVRSYLHKLDETGVREVLATLHRLSLITLDVGSTAREVRVHALVQRAHRDGWSVRQTKKVSRATATALTATWPKFYRNDARGQALLANGEALLSVIGMDMWVKEGLLLPSLLGNSLGDSGRVVEARDYFDRLCETTARIRTPYDFTTMLARIGRAAWRGKAGDPAGAVAELEQISADEHRVSPIYRRFTPGLLQSARQDLAHLRAQAGDVSGGIADLERILADQLGEHGPEHPEVLKTRYGLAKLHAEAAADDPVGEFDRLLPDLHQVLGPDDTHTLMARNDRAYWLAQSGRLADAIGALDQLVPDFERVYGHDNLETLFIRGGLVECLTRNGEQARAEVEGERLLADLVRVLGPGHEDVAELRRTLGAND